MTGIRDVSRDHDLHDERAARSRGLRQIRKAVCAVTDEEQVDDLMRTMTAALRLINASMLGGGVLRRRSFTHGKTERNIAAS